MKTRTATISLLALAASVGVGNAEDLSHAKTIHVGLDLSGSNPLVANTAYARQAASYVRSRIETLEVGENVHMNIFGALGLENSLYSYNAKVTRRVSSESVGREAERLVTGIASGAFDPQGQTNILFYLEFTPFDCASGDEIIVVTDGIESSSAIDSSGDLLEFGTGLPAPFKPGFLSGCTITFYGVGKTDRGSLPLLQVRNIQSAWEEYFAIAGGSFTALANVN